MKSAKDLEVEAAEWLALLDAGESLEWTQQFEDWLSADPRHRAAYLRLSVAWKRFDAFRKCAPLNGEVDADLLATHSAERKRRSTVRWLAAAACAVIVIAVVTIWQAATAGRTYSTAIGEFRRVVLEDGSAISLNTNTTVHVRFLRTERAVTLVQGEALFDVAHDKQRPFEVTAGVTVLRDVGTSFSVRLRDNKSVDVAVSEGSVAINPPFGPIVGSARIGSIRAGAAHFRAAAAGEIEQRLAWTGGRLSFAGARLADVIAEFNRYNTRLLLIEDPSLGDTHIGGTFPATDPEGFATALELLFPIRARAERRADGTRVIRLESAR
jgi:transmembrane sensor